MAKLSANGVELARLTRTIEPLNTELVVKKQEFLAFMSSGWILESSKVWFQDSSPWSRGGVRVHRYPWKRIGGAQEVYREVPVLVARFVKDGWVNA